MGNGNFRMGLHYFGAWKRRGNLLLSFVFALANFAVGSHRPHSNFPSGYIWETAISAWGYTTSVRGNDAATCCRRSSICASKFCRSYPFYEGQKFLKRYANGNGNFRMGLHISSTCGNTAIRITFETIKEFFN